MAGPTCSFCGKAREQADYLVAGPGGVSICDECAELASRVAREALASAGTDLLLTGISTAVSNDRRGGGLLGLIERPAIAIRGGRISWIGPEAELPRRYGDLPEHDCGGRAVVPGFIDADTHLLSGPDESDVAGALEFAGRMLTRGTTAIGVSVGGSDDAAAEGRILGAAGSLGARAPSAVTITWRVSGMDVARVAGHAAARVAGFAEVLCPGNEGAARVAKAIAPMKPRLQTCHQPVCRCWTGFEPVSATGARMLGSGAIPVLRPAGVDRFAVAIVDRLVADQRAVALASETSLSGLRVEGMAYLIGVAVECAGMPFEIALWAATRGGALALGDPERGRLRLGAHADLVVLDGPDPGVILDRPDADPAVAVVLGGVIVPR